LQISKKITIGIDATGGDFGEKEVCKGIIESISDKLNIKYILFGDATKVSNSFKELNFNFSKYDIELVDAKDKISMNDHPVFAIRNKKESSMVKASSYLIDKKIDAFVSSGNTGALVALAQFILKPINGIDRPVIAAIVPTEKNPMILIDSGCNVDSKPEWLYQYAILADTYYKLTFETTSPRIALLSVGNEENKGNALTLATYKLLKDNKSINFIGNLEARDLVYGVCDIIVTDGFSGNVFLKTYEGAATLLLKLIKEEIMKSFVTKIGGALIKPALKKLLKKYDAKVYGGAPILGTNYLVIKCHGNSKSTEYKNTIRQAYELTEKKLIANLIKEIEVQNGLKHC